MYETGDAQETQSQAIRRKYSDLQDLQQTAQDSLDWLRSQDSETALSCLEQLRDVKDPMSELCSVVAMHRAGRLLPKIPEHSVLTASSHLVKDELTVELVTRYPDAFPWLPEDKPSKYFSRPIRWDPLKRP